MKTFILEGNFLSYNISTLRPLEDIEGAVENLLPCPLLCVPDTTHTIRNRPFFIPESVGECRAQVFPAVRISRLGRHIAPRFASRYYDALTLCVTFTDAALLRRLRAAGLPWELSRGFDGSVCVGHFTGLEALNEERGYDDFRMVIDGETVVESSLCLALSHVDNAIGAISAYYKLADGDLILFGTPSEGVPVTPETHIEAQLGSETLLDFWVK